MKNIKQLNKYGTILMSFIENASFMKLGDTYRIEVEDGQYNLSLDIIDTYTEDRCFIEINAQTENDEFTYILMNYSRIQKEQFNNSNDLLNTLVVIDKEDLGESLGI